MNRGSLFQPSETDTGYIAGQEEPFSRPLAGQRKLSPEELDALKPVIQDLYINNGLTFREVQRILHARYDYSPTSRQFSDLRRRWKMKKNTSMTDRKNILEKLAVNEDLEEGRIGTISLNKSKVERWKREIADGAALSYGSPTFRVKDHPSRSKRSLHRPSNHRRLLLPRDNITHQPGTPKELKMTEGLIFSIEAFISGMYDQGAWLGPTTSQTGKFSVEKLGKSFAISSRLAGSVFSASELIKTNSYVEARRVLSNACGLVKDVLLSTHPASFGHMLRMLDDMTKEGLATLDDAVDMLRQYIGKMATIVLPKGHPFRTIWGLFGTVNRKMLSQLMLLTIRVLSDVLEKRLGQYNQDALVIRVYYIFKYYKVNSLPAGEMLLRKLLAGCPDPVVSVEPTFTIMGALGGILREQGRYEAYLAMGKEYTAIAQEHGETIDVINALRITARGYYTIGDQENAEACQRQAANLFLEKEKKNYSVSWAIQVLSLLESWVREWGRMADAEKIKEEINDLIKRDTPDVEDANI